MLPRLTFAFLVFASRFVLVVTQRPSFKARWNVSACCPNNGQWVAAGRWGARRSFKPFNFSNKRDAVSFVFLHFATTVCLKARVCFHRLFPSLAAAVVVFFASQACPTKNCVAFCRRRDPDGVGLPTYIFCALSLVLAQAAVQMKRGLFAVCAVSVHKISWSKRKVGPVFM